MAKLSKNGGGSSHSRNKLGNLFRSSDPNLTSTDDGNEANSSSKYRRLSNVSHPSPPRRDSSSTTPSPNASPSFLNSPLSQSASPYYKSPWNILPSFLNPFEYGSSSKHGLIGSLVREEGHIYSLASSGDLLYTGSDSRNIRVWKNLTEFSGFKSSSGLVKAIVVSGDKIFTGHQDGKIRVWRYFEKRNKAYKRVGNLPTTRDYIKSSMNPKNYVEVRRHRNVPWIRHYDAISCMSLDEERGLLYSGSWDKTIKVWRISDSKCLESINAHDDAVNSVAVGFDGFVFTGSADGSVKAWRRELVGRVTQHIQVKTLLTQAYAVTAVAVNTTEKAVYAGSSNGLVNFWEREKQFLVHGGVLRGHKMAVLCMAVSGRLVMSGSADKSICVWRREEVGGVHTCLAVLAGHTGPVKCLTVQEDHENVGYGKGDRGWIVYSGSLDRSVKLWRVSEQQPDMQQSHRTTVDVSSLQGNVRGA